MSIMKHSLLFLAATLIPLAAMAGDFEMPFELDLRRSAILVKASINGKPAVLLVDTGATRTIVSHELLAIPSYELRLSRFTTVGPGMRVEGVWMNVDLVLDKLSWRETTVGVMNMGDVSRAFGRRIDGFLGQDVMRKFRSVQIDFRNRKLIFVK